MLGTSWFGNLVLKALAVLFRLLPSAMALTIFAHISPTVRLLANVLFVCFFLLFICYSEWHLFKLFQQTFLCLGFVQIPSSGLYYNEKETKIAPCMYFQD